MCPGRRRPLVPKGQLPSGRAQRQLTRAARAVKNAVGRTDTNELQETCGTASVHLHKELRSSVSVRWTASLKPNGDSSIWDRFLTHRRPHHGSVVPRDLLVGNPRGFPPLGTDPRRVLPTPPYLHPLVPRMALSAPPRPPSPSLSRWPHGSSPFLNSGRSACLTAGSHVSSSFSDPGRSTCLPASPCPFPSSGDRHGSSGHPTPGTSGTGPQRPLSPSCPSRLRSGHAPPTPGRTGATVVINFPPTVRIFLASSPADMPGALTVWPP